MIASLIWCQSCIQPLRLICISCIQHKLQSEFFLIKASLAKPQRFPPLNLAMISNVLSACGTTAILSVFPPVFYQWLSKNLANKTSRSMMHVNYLWDMQCVSSWWTQDWFRYLHDVCIDMWFSLKVWLLWYVIYFVCIDRCGQVWAMVVCPFRALVVLYRMLLIFTWYEMSNVWPIVSTIVHYPRMFLPTDFL